MNTHATPVLSAEELATILAGLRLLQLHRGEYLSLSAGQNDAIDVIATNCDAFDPMNAEDIDRLCEYLNTVKPMGGGFDELEGKLFLRAYTGKLIEVRAMFPVVEPDGFAEEPANAYMKANPGLGLLAISNRIALLADAADSGITKAQLDKLVPPTVAVDMPIAPQHVATSPHPTVAMTMPLSPQFVGDVLCTMIEQGYPWFEWQDQTRENDPEDVIGWRYTSARAVEIDEDDQTEEGEGQSRIIDGAAIAEAITKILKGGLCNKTMMGYLATAVAENDAGSVDMDVADCIAQVAVFDELRYG